jgi:aspartyl-tRNA(Asn)/glutamyl-tRNA(Gln) amidotransferase subunit A
MSMNAFATLAELSAGLEAGDVNSVDLTRLYLDRIERANGRLNAFTAVFADRALEQARASDGRRSARAGLGTLDGIPVSVKDNFDIAGLPGTVGSKPWAGRLGDVTAAAVQRLEAAGMVVLGKNTMVEFAWGAWGTNHHCGTPWNPWDLATHRVPGGSSSGSGVAVAAGLSPAALGTDTGGSVRIPSAMNGVVGLKTTFGRVSLFGVYPLSTTLDTVGPLTRSVADARALFEVLVGPDPRDPGTYTALPAGAGRRPVAGSRISLLPEEHFPQPVEPAIREAWLRAARLFEELGAKVEDRPFPFDMAEFVQRIGRLISAESYAIHRGWIEDESLPFDPAVRARTLAGKPVSAADYIEARDHQRRSMAQFVEWMEGFDAVLTPSTATTAIPVAEVDETTTPAVFTRTANYLGACAITVPAGFSPAGLPIGVQLIGRPNDEETILALAEALEAATIDPRRHPDVEALLA